MLSIQLYTCPVGAMPFPLHFPVLAQCAQCKQFYWIEYLFCYLQWIFIFKWIFSNRKLCTSPKRKCLLFCTLKYFSHFKIFAFSMYETHLDFHQFSGKHYKLNLNLNVEVKIPRRKFIYAGWKSGEDYSLFIWANWINKLCDTTINHITRVMLVFCILIESWLWEVLRNSTKNIINQNISPDECW